ncbi:hypothetical protein Aperf_G00000101268 [Anoplocephala perfoliata]
MKLTRDVSTGDTLAVENPWAIGLWKKRTKYCYFCCKRCRNLIPCSGCPHVGFCSKACAQNAMKQDNSPKDGNSHLYDCHGLLPCICLNGIGEHSFDPEDILTAFKCISNVSPGRLLDYVCSTGPYEDGKGHQAFAGAKKIREVPPSVFDPCDYSAVAWLTANSDKFSTSELWHFTIVAVLLTYCLHIADYQMYWFEEANMENMNLFFCNPSPSNRPNRIPASWIAACILFHIQSTKVNAFALSQLIYGNNILPSSCVIASAIYPTISLINHSCNPSTSYVFKNRRTFSLYAQQPLQAGSEISVSYGPLFSTKSTCERRSILRKTYCFLCECEACINDWDEKSGKPETIKCPDCSKPFQESDECCLACKSKQGIQIFRSLTCEFIPRHADRLFKKGIWSTEDLKLVEEKLILAHSILSPPSQALSQLQEIHFGLLNCIHCTGTVERWKDK